MIDLSSYKSIESAILIKWVVPNFDTAYLTDFNQPITNGGDTFVNIGNLLSVTNTVSELTTSAGELTVNLSGVPTGSISDILSHDIKGSTITISRAFFDATTHQPIYLETGVFVYDRFRGIVTNYAITDSVDTGSGTATSTITLTCASKFELLNRKVTGRKTNTNDFPNESSMNRVQALSNSNFNFGAP